MITVSRPCLLTKTRPDSQIKTYVSFLELTTTLIKRVWAEFETDHLTYQDLGPRCVGLSYVKTDLPPEETYLLSFGNLRCTVYQKLKGKVLLAPSDIRRYVKLIATTLRDMLPDF